MSYSIGVDTGGTFTDSIVVDEKGNFLVGKAPSTPPTFAEGVIDSLRDASREAGVTLEHLLGSCLLFCHGSTVASNAMVTRAGSKTGLITTRGHEDIMSIQRAYGRVAGLSDDEIKHVIATDKPEPIVPKYLREGVIERLDHKGAVVVALDLQDARRCIRSLVEKGADSIGVSLLWSFMNPKHEQEIKRLIKEEYPHILVTLSSELVPLQGEYERTSTVVVNAYLMRTVQGYYKSLTETLRGMGLRVPPLIVQASGGVLPIDRAGDQAVSSIGSGPVAGLIASQFLGRLLGYRDIICTDVGGTTFDVGLILNDQVQTAVESVIVQHPLLVPTADVTSIGAGGGSICWIDAHGILHVGPQSAGAVPGPVCYDQGGEEPTVTDADLILGYLNPDYFLGGTMKLNKEKATRVLQEKVAKPLNMDLLQACAGIYDIVNTNMADLVRVRTVQRGYDPRDTVLFAYGGAGPMHAAEYGAELGVPLIVIPSLAPVFSAFGSIVSDILHEYEVSRYTLFPPDLETVNGIFEALEARGMDDLVREGIAERDRELRREMDIRYGLQIWEVRVPVPSRRLTAEDIARIPDEFTKRYEVIYGKGTALPGGGMEVAKFRMAAVGKIQRPVLKEYDLGPADTSQAIKQRRDVFFKKAGGFVRTNIYAGDQLKAGHKMAGPAVIEYPATTVIIPPGKEAEIDRYMNVVMR